MKKNVFPAQKDDPPLSGSLIGRRARFEETDQLGIVWHGRYASYFEDARTALGEQYGIGYLAFYEHGILAPIKQLHLDYNRPLRFQEECFVEAVLHWSDAARINISYTITDAGGGVTTTGHTVQVMLDRDFNLLLVPPPFYAQFREKMASRRARLKRVWITEARIVTASGDWTRPGTGSWREDRPSGRSRASPTGITARHDRRMHRRPCARRGRHSMIHGLLDRLLPAALGRPSRCPCPHGERQGRDRQPRTSPSRRGSGYGRYPAVPAAVHRRGEAAITSSRASISAAPAPLPRSPWRGPPP